MTEEEMYATYKGVYLPKVVHFRESLKYYEEFSFRPDDILIVTYPKEFSWSLSGSKWQMEAKKILIGSFAKLVLK